MTNLKKILCFLLIPVVSSCAGNPDIVFFDSRYEELFYDKTLYTKEVDGHKHEINYESCKRFPGLKKEKTTYDWVDRRHVDCPTLLMMEGAKKPEKSYFNKENLLDDIYRYMDLTSFRSSFGPRHLPSTTVFADFKEIEITNEDSNVLSLERDDWYYSVKPIAASDFDSDGVEDLLVLFYDDAKRSTYLYAGPIMLQRSGADGLIVAKKN